MKITWKNSNKFSPKLLKTMEIFKFYPKYPIIVFNANKTIITIAYSESVFSLLYLYFSLVNTIILNVIKWAIEKYNHSLSQIHSVLQDLILWIQSWSSLLNTALKVLKNNNNKISRNTTMRIRHKNIENQWDTFDTLIFN